MISPFILHTIIAQPYACVEGIAAEEQGLLKVVLRRKPRSVTQLLKDPAKGTRQFFSAVVLSICNNFKQTY
jgi:hypothetical protein